MENWKRKRRETKLVLLFNSFISNVNKFYSIMKKEICEFCHDTGETEEGQFDDYAFKKCICQIEE